MKADPNLLDSQGLSPLIKFLRTFISKIDSFSDILDKFIESGVDLNKSFPEAHLDITSLCLLNKKKHLLEKFIDKGLKIEKNSLSFHYYTLNTLFQDTSFQNAAKYFFSKFNVNPYGVDENGMTLLSLTLQKNLLENFYFLWDYFPEIKKTIHVKNKQGISAFHYLFINKLIYNLRDKILDEIDDFNDPVEKNSTLVSLIVASDGHLDLFKYLCDRSPSLISAFDDNGWSTLHAACFRLQYDIIEMILEKKVMDVNLKDKNGKFIFFYFLFNFFICYFLFFF